MTHQERLRKGMRYKLMRVLWVRSLDLSHWAGRRLIAWSRAAEDRDYPNTELSNSTPEMAEGKN